MDDEDFERVAEQRMTYCDACGTGTLAAMYILLPYVAGVLKFCRHHTFRHRAKLRDEGAFIYKLTVDGAKVEG